MKYLTSGLLAVLAMALVSYVVVAQPAGGREERRGRGQDRRGMRGDRGGRRFPMHPLMTALDADRDGTISAAEMAKAEAALKTLDKDSDGAISRDEMRQQFGGPGSRGTSEGSRRGGRSSGDSSRSQRQRSTRSGGGTFPTEGEPIPKTDAEKKILDVLEDMDKNQRRGMMNVPLGDGRLLRLLTETLGARHVVEIGTSNGYSGIWFSLALRTTGGKLTTFEVDAKRAALARENFKRAGVEKLITLIEGDAHSEVSKLKEPIDLLFLDADKEGYLDYLNKLLPLVRPGGLILAHNMNSRQADLKYVKAITTDPDLETLFLHKDAAGVGVTLKKR
ncbi:MAG: O-methyltransferase [Planctomycetota bacterium]|jgi:predicted O-methyltransferase YrrM